MIHRTALAIDPGERRTGLAGTDGAGIMALPLGTLEHDGFAALPAALRPVLEERRPEVLVVGVPLGSAGEAGPQARKVLALVEALRVAFPDLSVETVDESHTTNEAHELLEEAGFKAASRRRRADALAALAILRRWRGEA
ncbi:MAG: Holliday junction resolvase RuvX [Planctomycetota bacterium]